VTADDGIIANRGRKRRKAQHDPVVAALVANVASPRPPADFFIRFWDRVEAAGEGDDAPAKAEPESPTDLFAATPMLLADVRAAVDAFVVAGGGTSAEADGIATEVVAYVAYGWNSLGLRAIAGFPQMWTAHLKREAYRRWLAHLVQVRGGGNVPVCESQARARLLAASEAASMTRSDREPFERVYVWGFSVAETAVSYGLDHGEVIRRLRRIWAGTHASITQTGSETGVSP